MVKCVKCGKELEEEMDFCNECGTKIAKEEATIQESNIVETKAILNNEVSDSKSNLNVLAIISGALGLIFWGIGFYKCFVYDSGEYGVPINAYVGGDAYNFIINGTYFTAYAVIGGILILSSVILYGFSVINKTLGKQV